MLIDTESNRCLFCPFIFACLYAPWPNQPII